MALFFISAVSGTGKTTLMHELRGRGLIAHDTDPDCIRCSKVTGEPVSLEVAKRDGYDWIYPDTALQQLKSQSVDKDIYLLGIVDNLDDVQRQADYLIWMTIPLSVLENRLQSRQKEYGKSNSEKQQILEQYRQLNDLFASSIYTLDATKPVAEIADDVQNYVRSLSNSAEKE